MSSALTGGGRNNRADDNQPAETRVRRPGVSLGAGFCRRQYPPQFTAIHNKESVMTRDQQTQWAVEYLAANLSKEEVEDAERSITVQAFADFFAAQWPRTFNKMHFAAQVRQAAQAPVPQGIGDTSKK